MTSPAALIGIDWGTTSFRAYRIGADGRVIDSKSAPLGILKVPAGAFEQVFERELGQWLPDRAELPVIASGMITSRQGWVEVPYCPCPAGRDEIARALLQHLAVTAVERGYARVEWSVLDWNEPSINFYRKLGANPMEEWSTFRLTGEALAAFGARSAAGVHG